MAYPDIYDDCTELAQIETIDIVDYDRIQSMITTSENTTKASIESQGCVDLRNWVVNTNHKVSTLLKKSMLKG